MLARRRPGTHGQTERQTWQHCPFHCYHPTSPSRVGSAGPTIRTGKSSKKSQQKDSDQRWKDRRADVSKQRPSNKPVFSFFFQVPFQQQKNLKNFQLYQSCCRYQLAYEKQANCKQNGPSFPQIRFLCDQSDCSYPSFKLLYSKFVFFSLFVSEKAPAFAEPVEITGSSARHKKRGFWKKTHRLCCVLVICW